jgi:Zn-dependent M28 family amino/carboxypeptidase
VDNLKAHVRVLADTIGERNVWQYAALQRAAEYIEVQLAASGYQTARQTYEVARVPVSNIEAVLDGTDRRDESVVLGAHYDTVGGCPGANDNGTGVAALLELARRFARQPQPHTLRFVAFVNEEPPFFQTPQMGSYVYAKAAQSRGDRILAMLSLETMGYYSDERGSQEYPEPLGAMYPDVGNFIGFVANPESEALLSRARRAFERRRTSLPVQALAGPADMPGVAWSDQWSFWQAGYPAMMVTDTAPFRYPWYHTPHDTPDKVDFTRLAQVVDGLEAVVCALAAPHELSTDSNG